MKSWRDDAACLGLPTDLFFPEPHDQQGRAAALAVCARCPVAAACLADALTTERSNSETHGIRGGMVAKRRREARKALNCPIEPVDPAPLLGPSPQDDGTPAHTEAAGLSRTARRTLPTITRCTCGGWTCAKTWQRTPHDCPLDGEVPA